MNKQVLQPWIHNSYSKSNTTGATSGAGTAYTSRAPEFTTVFSGVRVSRSLVLCVMVCRSLFVLLYFFIWSLGCLSFFDLRILIIPVVSSNSSWIHNSYHIESLTLAILFDKCMWKKIQLSTSFDDISPWHDNIKINTNTSNLVLTSRFWNNLQQVSSYLNKNVDI